MPKFNLSGALTISVYTEIEADTLEEAIAEAESRPILSLCHSCAGGEPQEEWVTSGELDGEVVEVKDADA